MPYIMKYLKYLKISKFSNLLENTPFSQLNYYASKTISSEIQLFSNYWHANLTMKEINNKPSLFKFVLKFNSNFID